MRTCNLSLHPLCLLAALTVFHPGKLRANLPLPLPRHPLPQEKDTSGAAAQDRATGRSLWLTPVDGGSVGWLARDYDHRSP